LLRFLLPATDGPNALLLAHQGPPAARIAWGDGTAAVEVPALRGFRYEFQTASALHPADWVPLESRSTSEPWSRLDLLDRPGRPHQFYRVRVHQH